MSSSPEEPVQPTTTSSEEPQPSSTPASLSPVVKKPVESRLQRYRNTKSGRDICKDVLVVVGVIALVIGIFLLLDHYVFHDEGEATQGYSWKIGGKENGPVDDLYINVGGQFSIIDPEDDHVVWQPDDAFLRNPGKEDSRLESDSHCQSKIEDPVMKQVYCTDRFFSNERIIYAIPVSNPNNKDDADSDDDDEDETYTVMLHFMAWNRDAENWNIINIDIEDHQYTAVDYNLYETVGDELYTPTTITATGIYDKDKNGMIMITLSPTYPREHPNIKAIEIHRENREPKEQEESS